MIRSLLYPFAFLALTACNSEPAAKTATTKLEAVEVEPGTISDSMIVLDDASGDGTAVDNSIPDDGTAKPAAKAGGASGDDPSDDADDASDEAETAPAPASKKTEAPAPAKTTGE